MAQTQNGNSPDAENGAGEQHENEAVPVLSEVDDSSSGRFGPAVAPLTELAVTELSPGGTGFTAADFEDTGTGGPPIPTLRPIVIDVEFKNAEIPRSILQRYGPTGGPAEGAGDWPEALEQLLNSFNYLKWERTFPASYSRSWKVVESPASRDIASDRDRFISFYFHPNADTSLIVKALVQLSSVARAGVLPTPGPSSPLSEPLLGVNDQVNPSHFMASGGALQNQWYIFRCGVNHAWQLLDGGVSGQGVVVADIDWGFSHNHEDLRRIEFKHNTYKDDDLNPANDASVSNGEEITHGTAVLGLAGAAANGFGMAGVAYGSDLWAIQAGDNVIRDHKHWVEAIDLVREKDSEDRRKVIILEIQTRDGRGNIEQSIRINQAIKDAISAGVVVCVPAGNAGKSAEVADDGETPIPETGSILVGATKFNPNSTINERADSNFGERVVVYAPGDRNNDVTCSPDFTNRAYRNNFGGTSGATAKVAGVVALMLQANGELKHEDIRDILRQTGTPVANDPSGRFLDAREAVRKALELVD